MIFPEFSLQLIGLHFLRSKRDMEEIQLFALAECISREFLFLFLTKNYSIALLPSVISLTAISKTKEFQERGGGSGPHLSLKHCTTTVLHVDGATNGPLCATNGSFATKGSFERGMLSFSGGLDSARSVSLSMFEIYSKALPLIYHSHLKSTQRPCR